MTVKEVIAALGQLPGDCRVCAESEISTWEFTAEDIGLRRESYVVLGYRHTFAAPLGSEIGRKALKALYAVDTGVPDAVRRVENG